jgi:hypothetical protein
MNWIRPERYPRLIRVLSTRWQRRVVFLLGGVAVGASAVALALLADRAQAAFALLLGEWRYASLLVTPLGFVLAVYLTNRYFPNSQGSGIPQAIAARELDDHTARGRLVSIRIAVGKILLTLLGLLCGASAGREPAQGDAEAADQGEEQAMRPGPSAQGAGKAARHCDDDAAEQSAGQSAHHAAHRHGEPIDAGPQHRRRGAELGVVADQRERGQAGGNHRGDDQAAGAGLEGAAHLLDAEHDAGQRRVEGGGDAGRRAGQDQPGLAPRRETTDREHDGGADLDGRTLAAGPRAARKAEQDKQ